MKLLGFMIVCIPLYACGSESFSVKLSLYETPRYAMSTSYDDRYSPIPIGKPPPNAADYLLEGVGGFIGEVAGFLVAFPLLWEGENAAALLIPFGASGGVTLTAKWMGNKGSYWLSLLGTAVGFVGSIGLLQMASDMKSPFIAIVGVSLPAVGGVWGYHLGGHSH